MNLNKRYWKKRSVLVTGHAGFLGSWLSKTLIDLEAQVVGIDKRPVRNNSILKGYRSKFVSIKGNINNRSKVEQVMKRACPSVIFHLAAEAIVEEGLKNPLNTFETNIVGTVNILEASRNCPSIESIIVASSDKAYGDHKRLPYTEKAALKGRHPYDASKSCADLITQTYYHTYNVPVAITRCGNIFGPGDFHYSRIVPDALRKMLKGRQLEVRSNGKFTRDYIYVEDIVEGYLLLAQKLKRLKLAGEAFNFSNESPLTVLQLFERIRAMVDKKATRPKILNKAEYEIHHQYLSSRKARKLLGWRARHNLKEGLQKTISWYKDNG